ncbi:hypothetical protein NBRC110019_07520 [Neptunitalea chrysea]|uniref:Terminase ATPase subunit N-terminal domain-containing protein n=1 Tax=Neptunitalea chrysea TaxID=1647581 RepID=A0A9W6EVM1_9FLAO|nr:transposase [Neptunitalea chrysea]GLB51713.1 hypothetical protein NBRC110019_07520 [Neptunitalea chrysea]
MAKDSERSVARILYIDQGKSNKEIAEKLGVQEKTVGNWVKKYGWKEERDARDNNVDARIENIKAVIDDIIADRTSARLKIKQVKIDLEHPRTPEDEAKTLRDELSTLKKEIVGYDDSISKWNKTLDNFNKENKVSLATYLHVMDELFKDMQAHNQDLYLKTLDFQEQHISKVSVQLG